MTGPTDDRWLEVDWLFREALQRPASERLSFVREASRGDPELRSAVLELLELESECGEFLARPVDALASVPWDEVLSEVTRSGESGDVSRRETDRCGERVGAYRLVRRLGRGGMATVYLAERADGLWEQQVALKLIRRGLDTTDVVRRFVAERQILSSLSHPNIARLLDGGTTDDGLPYLVMEYVEGTSITEYCDARALGVDERLELFCDMARAVQHAHRSLVVHRDLKPSNILVTEDGRVKLLDFGIAKILDPAREATATRTGLRPLTPEYASPEQVGAAAITTASDVYQLGLILCELLSGDRPYRVRRLLSPSRLEAYLREVEPARPSSLVTPASAAARSESPARLTRRLRGDLDTIVLQAIPREPDRRYASAEALVADVERHVRGLPVRARPPTLGYQVQKLLRRRPWIGPVVVGLTLILVGYFFTLARHSGHLERERNLARQEAKRAEEVQEFLVDVFRSVDPYAPNGAGETDVALREMLARGADRVRSELGERPELQGELLSAISDVYTNLDLVEEARNLREEALAHQRRAHGPTSAVVARELRKLAKILKVEGRYDSAQVLLARSLELTRAARGPADTAVAGVLTDLGNLASERGAPEEAERHLISAVELLRHREPLPAAHLAGAYTALGSVYMMNNRRVEARAAAEEAVRLSRTAYGDDHPRTAIALYELADLHDWDGRRRDAIPIYDEAIDVLDGSLGPEHERTLEARSNLAVTLRNLGKLAAAEAVQRDILAISREKRGDRHRSVGDALQNLAVVLHEKGELAEAERRLVEARDIYDRVLDPEHYVRSYPRLTLASVRIDRGEFEAAEAVAREAVEILREAFSGPSYVTAAAECRLARTLAGQGRRSEARWLLESSIETMVETVQPSPRYEIECRRALVEIFEETDRPHLAGPHLAAIRTLEEGSSTP